MSGYAWTVPAASVANANVVGERANQRDRLWGSDIWLDVTGGNRADVVTTHAGDVAIVTGREALRQAIIRRIITAPGDYAILPNYGAGARLYVKARNAKSVRDELVARIQAQLAAEPRVLRVDQIVVEQLEDGSGIRINVVVLPKGAARPEDTMLVSIQGRAA